MKTIWKFPLNPTSTEIEMPKGAMIIACQSQSGAGANLWAVVDPEAEKETRRFTTYGTGHELPDNPGVYTGTFQIHGGALVLHVFEKTTTETMKDNQMTHSAASQCREAFEKFAKVDKYGFILERDHFGYLSDATERAWRVWQAAWDAQLDGLLLRAAREAQKTGEIPARFLRDVAQYTPEPREGGGAEDREEEIAKWKGRFIAFAVIHMTKFGRERFGPCHLHPLHYDLLEEAGARLDDFKRASEPEPG